ncbi:MAG: DEAD/DEAH box helicase family protein, partial [Thermoplasmata archaeon]|nr:DEAD/DEAH box helicase family protein [Thermoplasmata archaeon]
MEKLELRSYQKEAIDKWRKNGYRGILSMATGTGKTIIAIEAIRDFLNEGKIGLIIVPTKTLLKQWHEVIKNSFSKPIVVCCYSENPDWKEKLNNLVKLYMREKRLFSYEREKLIISTMGTAWKKEFGELIGSLSYDDVIVIIDEAHRVGAFRYRNILELPFKKRMGLSATPVREWDNTGTKKINEYFGGIVYRYTLSNAIRDGYLTPYKYYV